MKNLKYKKFVRLGHKFLWSKKGEYGHSSADLYICEKCNCKIEVFHNNFDELFEAEPVNFIEFKLTCDEYIIKSIIE